MSLIFNWCIYSESITSGQLLQLQWQPTAGELAAARLKCISWISARRILLKYAAIGLSDLAELMEISIASGHQTQRFQLLLLHHMSKSPWARCWKRETSLLYYYKCKLSWQLVPVANKVFFTNCGKSRNNPTETTTGEKHYEENVQT